MGIRIPQRSVTDSVLDKIESVLGQMQQAAVSEHSAALDAALTAPVGDVAPLEGAEEAVAARALDL